MIRSVFKGFLLAILVFGMILPNLIYAQQNQQRSNPRLNIPGQASSPDSPLESPEAKTAFISGLTFALLNDHEKALPQLEKALSLSPESPTILSALSRTHQELGNQSEALFYAAGARSLEAGNITWHEHLLSLNLSFSFWEEAIKVADVALTQFGTNSIFLLGKSEALINSGRPADALPLLSAILTDDVRNLEAIIKRATVYGELDQYDNQVSDLEIVLSISPNDPKLYLEAIDQTKDHSFPFADSITTQATEIWPNNAEFRVLKQSFSAQQIASSDSQDNLAGEEINIEALENAYQQNPTDLNAANLLADAFMQKGSSLKAAEIYQQMTNQNIRLIDAWKKGAQAWLAAQNPEQAFVMADEAALFFPGELAILTAGGEALRRLNRLDEAKSWIENGAFLTDDAEIDDRINHQLLMAKMSAGCVMFEAIQDNYPTNVNVLKASASCYLQNDQLENAKNIIQDLSDDEQDNAFLSGWLALKESRNDEALTDLKAAYDRTTHPSPLLLEVLGDVYLASGNVVEAKKYWQLALAGNTINHNRINQKINNQ